mgnify:FL=1
MATTKVIKELTEFNPGNPDYVLNATNAVTVINAGGNQYNFNGVYGKFGLRIGTTVLTGVPSAHPIAVLNNGLTGITYTGTVNEGTLVVGGITYTFYSGDVTITVTGNFGVASYYCKIHGYMGGENNFVSVYSTAGLKMPKGAAYSGTADPGMVRNSSETQSQGSTNVMQHFNGTNWKNYENKVSFNYTTDFLAVGGGGASGSNEGGGGGGGGLLTSVSTDTNGGSLNTRESTLTLTSATAYTITIGNGGAKGTYTSPAGPFTIASPGDSTTISGTGITTITANGGGYGGTGETTGPLYPGGAGASGGGGSRGTTAIPGGTATNSGNQGFSGGASSTNSDSSGGGGGAGEVGVSRPGNLQGGADGGDGRISTIITTAIATSQSVGQVVGTDVYFSGGGGGGGFNGVAVGAGGDGGGQNGTQNSVAANGSPNTGGSGGGGAGSGGSDSSGYVERIGGSGGSGVVILKIFTILFI